MGDIQCECMQPTSLSEAADAVWHDIRDTCAMGIWDIQTLDLTVLGLVPISLIDFSVSVSWAPSYSRRVWSAASCNGIAQG